MKMTMRANLAAILLLAATAGCAKLQVEVYQYKGELSQSFRTRLAQARGDANHAYAVIQAEPSLKAYFEALDGATLPNQGKARTPGTIVATANKVLDEVNETLKSGIPRPDSMPSDLPPEERRTRLEARDLVLRKLSVMEKDFIELGEYLKTFTADTVLAHQKEGNSSSVSVAAQELNKIGTELLFKLKHPDFSDVITDEENWHLMNPVHMFGGLGKSEFIVYKDETGNYQLKSAVFDPSDVAQAARKTSNSILKIVSSIYGIPLPTGSGPRQEVAQGADSIDTLKVETKKTREQLFELEKHNSILKESLEQIRADLRGQNGQPLAAFVGGTPEERAVGARAAIDRLKREVDSFLKRTGEITGKP
jgi:hypothetical protein